MRLRGLRSPSYKITKRKSDNSQRGYMLITLMFALTLITIGMLTVLPAVKQQILRDREDEMRHRGTAYMRAIQHFYKKFGRYPMRVEELEETNNLHFIRKRYKDPMNRDPVTGKEKDFKFLHQQDISLNNGPVLGQTPGLNGPSGPGGIPGQNGLQGAGGAAGGLAGLQNVLGGGAQAGGIQQTANASAQTPGGGDSADAGDEEGKPNSGGSSSSSPGASSSSSSSSSSGFNGPTFGGGPILGVASMSKAKSIRVFYEKNHYNDWLFIYVPQADRGGLLVGPINPGMPTGNMGGVPGQQVGGVPGVGAPVSGLTPNAGQSPNPAPQPQPTPGQTPPEQ